MLAGSILTDIAGMAPAAMRPCDSPNGWTDLATCKRHILSDLGSVIDIPEGDPRPFITLDAALLQQDSYLLASRSAPIYKTNKPIVFAESMCVIRFKDGSESLLLYSQNYDMLKSTAMGNALVHMPLPLKERSKFKTESRAFYLNNQELASEVKSISASPIHTVPDLEGFIKAYDPFKQMGISSLKDIVARREMTTIENIELSMKAVENRYVRQNVRPPRQSAQLSLSHLVSPELLT